MPPHAPHRKQKAFDITLMYAMLLQYVCMYVWHTHTTPKHIHVISTYILVQIHIHIHIYLANQQLLRSGAVFAKFYVHYNLKTKRVIVIIIVIVTAYVIVIVYRQLPCIRSPFLSVFLVFVLFFLSFGHIHLKNLIFFFFCCN